MSYYILVIEKLSNFFAKIFKFFFQKKGVDVRPRTSSLFNIDIDQTNDQVNNSIQSESSYPRNANREMKATQD